MTKDSALGPLVAAAGTRPILLVLDNCEHVIGSCARVVDTLLAGCSRLQILATSREPLRVAGEIIWRVAPFALPTAPELFDAFTRSDAVRLFVARARSRRPDFAITSGNAAAIAAISRLVDGIPLAIELAAGQTVALSPEDIAVRLRESNDLLIRGNRTTARQETVQATLDWSYALLSERQRRIFRRLSVFPSSFALDDAEFVLGEDDHVEDSLALVTDLVEKSLVEAMVDRAEGTRYRLLQPVRQYARALLSLEGKSDAVERRFAEGILRLSALAEPRLMSAERTSWMRRLTEDEENIRAALEWSRRAQTSQDVDIGVGIAGNLVFFWSLRGKASEGFEWVEALLPHGSGGNTRTRAKALYAAAEMAFVTGRVVLARERIDECVALWREIGDKRGLAYALQSLPMSSGHPNAREAVSESLRLFSEVGDEWGAAFDTGAVDLFDLMRGDDRDGSAKRRLEDTVLRFRRLGDDWAAGQMLNILGDAARGEQNDGTAEKYYAESLRLLRASGIYGSEASLLQNLGYLRLRARDLQQARRMFAAALEIFRNQGDRRGEADCLDGLAGVLEAIGQPDAGARLIGAAEALRVRNSAQVWPANAGQQQRTVSGLRVALGEPIFAVRIAEGMAAADELVDRQIVRPANLPGLLEGTGGLTPRELEVAALVAGGLTNRQIGGELFVAEETARLHVKHILSKLGFTSRAQIASWAVERGLAAAPETI